MTEHRDNDLQLVVAHPFGTDATGWEQYDRALEDSGGALQQSGKWATYQATFPDRRPLGAFVLRGGGVTALTCSLVAQQLPGGFTYLLAPRGPRVHAGAPVGALRDLQRELREQFPRALFVRLDPPLATGTPGAARWEELGRVAKAWPSYVETTPTTTLLLDLSLSEEALLAQMHPKGRYNIKVAHRHGVTCRTGALHDLAHVHRLFQETAARTGIAVHPERVYAAMLETLDSAAELELASIDGELLAALITTRFAGTTTYYYGASSSARREVMAPYALQWHAITKARDRGDRWYDVLGIAPEGAPSTHPLAGVTDFKRKLGGVVRTEVGPIDLPLRPSLARAFRLARQVRRIVRR